MKQFLRHQKRLIRGPRFAVLAALLAVAAVGLTQCRIVGENVTGIETESHRFSGRNRCMHKCEKIYRDARALEDLRHRLALRKCDRLGRKDEDECRRNEHRVHRAILEKLEDMKKACKNKCYNEGGGRGGR
jgi:hypothetical protein